MNSTDTTEPPDLMSCDREPIHIPGRIQPQGVLLAVDFKDFTVRQASENLHTITGSPTADLLGGPLAGVIGEEGVRHLSGRLRRLVSGERPECLETVRLGPSGQEKKYDLIAHRNNGKIILEFESIVTEEFPETHSALESLLGQLETAKTLAELSNQTAAEARRLTGFDRILVYLFDEEGNGTVLGEDRNENLPSYLGLRFPASDIPRQARELYRVSHVRIIPDVDYQAVGVLAERPFTEPLDLTHAILRSVSPVHLEYMRNMRTIASMSVSILRDGQLWGLISGHHATPRRIPFTIRRSCDLFAKAFALRLSALERTQELERRVEVRALFSKLLAVMAGRGDYVRGLLENAHELLSFVDAGGAAVVSESFCEVVGETPTKEQIRELANWLFAGGHTEVFHSESLATVFPPAGEFGSTASGLLAIGVSKLHAGYVMWFRPEVVRTVNWAGDPAKSMTPAPGGERISPRQSFEMWKETVRGKSLSWREAEVEAAIELRNAIVGVVLRKAEEMADLTAELTRSNSELESFSYSVSHDLRAPLRHVVGYAEMLKDSVSDRLTETDQRYIRTIIESSEFAGMLVDKLLAFSRMGRMEVVRTKVDLNKLVEEIRRQLIAPDSERRITWKIEPLPPVRGDQTMLRMAMQNLMENAVKYSRDREEAIIEITGHEEGKETIIAVRDNGIGFDMRYVDKLFGIFQRLHRVEEYEGTGIGLANVRRVISRHGGRTWAEAIVGQGAVFYFSLPRTTT
ncbi:ATP-binding protein [Zavarzinella formosa]|uniref:ATP-binding protein n=1 Tax=Zavarzinella formosa TaxID=360055 RepID=UPI0002F963E4|nr:ATP-binding protein [Zavarzinella formosa]